MHDPDFFDKLDVGAHRIQSGGDLISEYVASKDVMHDPVFPGIVDAQSPRSAKSPLSEMRAIRAAMEDPAIDEDFDFQNLCAAFSCLRVPWSVIKQRRRSHCVVRKSLDADLEDKPCSMDLEPLGRGNKVLAGSVEQVHTSLHPRYPQRKRCRRPFLSEYLSMELPDEASSELREVPLPDFPVLAPVPLAPSPDLPLGAMSPQADVWSTRAFADHLGREKRFRNRYARAGKEFAAGNRLQAGQGSQKKCDALDAMNFGISDELTYAELERYRVYEFVDGARVVRSSTLLGASSKSRMSYLWNKESERRKSAEGGNASLKCYDTLMTPVSASVVVDWSSFAVVDAGSCLGQWRSKCLQASILELCSDPTTRASLRNTFASESRNHAGASMDGSVLQRHNLHVVRQVLLQARLCVHVLVAEDEMPATGPSCGRCWQLGHPEGHVLGVVLWSIGDSHVSVCHGVRFEDVAQNSEQT